MLVEVWLYWPEMAKELVTSREVVRGSNVGDPYCAKFHCYVILVTKTSLDVAGPYLFKRPKIGDKHILSFFSIDCSDRTNVIKIQRKSSKVFVGYGLQFIRGFNQAPLRCIKVMKCPKFLKKFIQ